MKVYVGYTEMYPVLLCIRETQMYEGESSLLDIPDDLVHNYQEAEKNLKLAKKNIEIYAKNKGYKIEG
jgi:hypothetical protein